MSPPNERPAAVTLASVGARIAAAFPTLREDIEADPGLGHLHVGALAAHVQAAIDAGETATIRAAMHLAHALVVTGDAAVRNAIGVSLLEHLSFDGPRGAAAWAVVPEPLRAMTRDVRASLRPAAGDARIGSPPPATGKGRKRRGS